MASKTRDKLIEAAKQLFIRHGVDNVTISDIANATDKGRRTIYTYFNSKREIYKAVVEKESEKMVGELRAITDYNSSASDKLRQYINLRLSQTKGNTSGYASIKSLLSIDFGMSERASRKKALEKEETILNNIIAEGIASGEFDMERGMLLKRFLFPLMKITDSAVGNDDVAALVNADFCESICDYIIDSVVVKKS